MIEMPRFIYDGDVAGIAEACRSRVEKLENTIREMYARARGPAAGNVFPEAPSTLSARSGRD